jgi:hypothetical protein
MSPLAEEYHVGFLGLAIASMGEGGYLAPIFDFCLPTKSTIVPNGPN